MSEKIAKRFSIMGLTESDINLIREAGEHLAPKIDSIVESFYEHLVLYEPLRELIAQSTTTDRLKRTFRRYLERLFRGSYDQSYEQERVQIGLTHHRVGLSLNWYLSMFGYLESQIFNILEPKYHDRPLRDWIDVTRALATLLKFDQLLAVDAYVEAYTAALRRETLAAQAARESKSLFLAKVSHELRTPLSSILGFTDLILDTSREISPATRQHLQVLHRNATNLLSMINGLIEIGKVGSGKWQSSSTSGTISELLDDMAINAEGLLVGKPVQINRTYRKKSARPVYLDFSKLRQILLNLVSNACKFTDRGSVSLDYDQTEDIVSIKVADSGIGIPADQKYKVFDEFYRIQDGVTRKPGSGLGLTLVKTLVESMNGSIDVSNADPHGTVFTVKVPLH